MSELTSKGDATQLVYLDAMDGLASGGKRQTLMPICLFMRDEYAGIR